MLWGLQHLCPGGDGRHRGLGLSQVSVSSHPTVPCLTDLCKNCHHLIARHEYTFSVVDDYQEYTMLCLLCGRAEDSVSILPDDPRQMTPLF